MARIFLLHIPKTGGTSIEDAISPLVGANAMARHIEALSETERAKLTNKKFLSGHLLLSQWKSLPFAADYKIAVALREPYARLASAIRMLDRINKPGNASERATHHSDMQELADKLGHVNFSNVSDISAFVKDVTRTSAYAFDNVQVRFLACNETEQSAALPANALEIATSRLRQMDVVFLTERLSDGIASIVRLLGHSPPTNLPVSNTAIGIYGEKGRVIDHTDRAIRDALTPWVEQDLRLYAIARELNASAEREFYEPALDVTIPIFGGMFVETVALTPGVKVSQRFQLHYPTLSSINTEVVAFNKQPSPYRIHWQAAGEGGDSLGRGSVSAAGLSDWQTLEFLLQSPKGGLEIELSFSVDPAADVVNPVGLALFENGGQPGTPVAVNGVLKDNRRLGLRIKYSRSSVVGT
ncbi:sulfotransferase family 2 domain-containing protein [Phyllobacterium lublinensis]|uniref:sulfotransferase family 2 domain-containing protein n=1 Tax=Phyllobacterium lublinensis TaxID=2875708 RepID=UPI001CCD2E91|nr:sulfotransferase family 2 domain-containing protein [Phyllobacterium sp. 2063]MBZ9654454.1 sulfotransferase family 2 domain-containing protein [Phyllobacterium sp. 2063]